MMELLLAGGFAIAAGHLIAERLLQESTVEELGILLSASDTSWLLSSGWGAEDFPEFSGAAWGQDDRKFYRMLMKRMKGPRYGASRKLLKGLISIEDRRQEAKKDLAQGDGSYIQRTAALLSSYGKREGFEGFLARFLVKRHKERISDGTGG